MRSRVVLKVYDILGREVSTLADGMYDAGSYTVRADFTVDEKTKTLWEDRDRELQGLRSPEAWRARQQRTRARLPEILGDFGTKCPLDARIVGKLDRPDYTIEKLVFQSQPKYYCTANVYVPKRRPFPQPGVLFTCGHSAEGKAAPAAGSTTVITAGADWLGVTAEELLRAIRDPLRFSVQGQRVAIAPVPRQLVARLQVDVGRCQVGPGDREPAHRESKNRERDRQPRANPHGSILRGERGYKVDARLSRNWP